MNSNEIKEHWENVFLTKNTSKVSWYQPIPETSVELINSLELPKSSNIIDAGCGDSYLPDYLLKEGFTNITLVDISEKALETVKNRLGEKTHTVSFQNSEITRFSTNRKFDLWHDRAVFHFLTDKIRIENYVSTVTESIVPGGHMIIGTFSNNGPDQCSGLTVQQYSEVELTEVFNASFRKVKCFTENHTTPSGGNQNFLFCLFQKIN